MSIGNKKIVFIILFIVGGLSGFSYPPHPAGTFAFVGIWLLFGSIAVYIRGYKEKNKKMKLIAFLIAIISAVVPVIVGFVV